MKTYNTITALTIFTTIALYIFHFCGLFNLHWYGLMICIIAFSSAFEFVGWSIDKEFVSEPIKGGSFFVFFLFAQLIAISSLSIFKIGWDRAKDQQQILTTQIPKLEKQFNIKLTSKEAKCDFVKFPFILVGFLEDRGDKVQVVILKNNLNCDAENCYCRNVGDVALIDKEHFIPGKSTFLITEGNVLLMTNGEH